MGTEFYVDSLGEGKLHCCTWAPEGEPRAIVQLVHGISDYLERYEPFARYLNTLDILVVGEDHMGHGHSFPEGGTQGYFAGGWFRAVEDTHRLMKRTMAEYPGVPYILFGHSMGSFMARTILAKYPDCGICAAVICGTAWQPRRLLPAVKTLAEGFCRVCGERTPSDALQGMVFAGYNARVEHPRTDFDWVNRDSKMVDAYIADPLCGFTASCGLIRDMMTGVSYIEDPENLARMRKDLPVLFIAGGADPVGNYGKGVLRTVEEFEKAGMTKLSHRIYPLCRHEILNEINRQEIYADVGSWLKQVLKAEETYETVLI